MRTINSDSPLSGRRAQAARNDQIILDAARKVFVDDPEAPIARVAKEAGVGIGALYRRFGSKEELLQHLATDGLQRYVDAGNAALASIDEGSDPWVSFVGFMQRCLDADVGTLSAGSAGRFTATDELQHLAQRAHDLTEQLLERAIEAKSLRADIGANDIHLLFEALQAIHVKDPQRTIQYKNRYLALILDALHFQSERRLPGPAPEWEEIVRRYD